MTRGHCGVCGRQYSECVCGSGPKDDPAADEQRCAWCKCLTCCSECHGRLERLERLERVAEAARKAIEDHAISMANEPDEQGRVHVLEPYWEPVLELLQALDAPEGSAP